MHQWSSGFRHTPAKRINGGSNPSWCSNKCRSLAEKDIGSYPMLSEFEPHVRYILLCSLMGKRHLDMVKRVGSLPTRATKYWELAHFGRVLVLHTRGGGIVARIPNKCSDGGMVDTLCLSRSVLCWREGSSPSRSTEKKINAKQQLLRKFLLYL